MRRCRSFRGAKGDHFECASNVDSEKKLYYAFVDYRKAVDPLKRTMLRTSIDNKILIVNQNLYKNAKCCVRGGSICSLHILELDRVKIYHP